MAKRRRRSAVPGLTWRGRRAYWDRVHARLPGGRVNKSLHTSTRDVAATRAAALNTLLDRGDWEVLARWAADELRVEDLVRAVTDGEYRRLRRLHRDGLKIGDVADSYLARVEATLSPRTREIYGSIVGRAVAHFGPERRLHEISTAEAEAYLHAPQPTARDAPWSPRSQQTRRAVLGALWRLAIEREREEADRAGATVTLTRNPWRAAKIPIVRQTRVSYLSPLEVRALLAHPEISGTPVHALLATAIFAGLRSGEIAHLRTDLDVVVTDSPATSRIIVQGRDGEHAWRPKTARGERELTTIQALWELLRDHREHFAGERFFFCPEPADRPPSESSMRTWTLEAFRAAGIKYGRDGDGLTLHSLRHTYATWQVSAGIPIPTVARRMGDRPDVVLRVYAHVMPDDEARADQVLQDLAAPEPSSRHSTPSANSTAARL